MKADAQTKRAYDVVMLQVRSILFTEQGVKSEVELIKSAGHPIEGIAYAAAMVLRSVNGGYKKKGKNIPPEVLAAAMIETVGDVIEIASAAGLIKPEDKKEVAKVAIKMAGDIFKKAPKAQPQGIAAAQQGAAPQAVPQGGPPPPQGPQGLVQQAMGA